MFADSDHCPKLSLKVQE